MPILDYRGTPLEVTGEGFLASPGEWDEGIALFLAREQEGLTGLTEEHWAVIVYIRRFYEEHGIAPLIRKICKTTGLKLKHIYELFPSGPAKGACKLAGLPSADGCI